MPFLEKNISSFVEVIHKSLYARDMAERKGFLQLLDPRTKIICFGMFLIAANLSFNFAKIFTIYFLLLFLAFLSRIPLKNFILRVWIFLPFFTGIIAFPATLNIFVPGKPVFTLLTLPSMHLVIAFTDTGIRSALLLVTRVATSVSLTVLLILTTDWISLMKALEILHFPRIGILICLMTYRYIFVLLEICDNLFLARKSRIVGKISEKTGRLWISSGVGVLFSKTQKMGDEVYGAMRSRGFAGKVQILNNFAFSAYDFFAFAGTWVYIASLYYFWK